MIKVLLWDIDGTLLNFEKAEYAAINACFKHFNLGTCSDEMIARYSVINRKYWEKLERNEITKDRVLVGRFEDFFSEECLDVSVAEEFNKAYQLALGDTIVFEDYAYELLTNYQQLGYKQYAVTNGTKVAQEKKLRLSKLDKIFDDVFISEDLGYEKPNSEFFNIVLNKIGNYQKEEMIIIGDSLTSDIQGGNNAGIKCCWYNPKHLKQPNHLLINVTIDNLKQFDDYLKSSNG